MFIPRKVLSGLARVCDTENSKYALANIKFRRGKNRRPIAAATDGRTLMAATWTEQTSPEVVEVHQKHGDMVNMQMGDGFMVPAAVAKKAKAASAEEKTSIKRKPVYGFAFVDETAPAGLVVCSQESVTKHAIDNDASTGRFPVVGEVAPEKFPHLARLDARRLRDALDAIIDASESPEDPMIPLAVSIGILPAAKGGPNQDRPVLLLADVDSWGREAKTQVLALVMPLSSDPDHRNIPAEIEYFPASANFAEKKPPKKKAVRSGEQKSKHKAKRRAKK